MRDRDEGFEDRRARAMLNAARSMSESALKRIHGARLREFHRELERQGWGVFRVPPLGGPTRLVEFEVPPGAPRPRVGDVVDLASSEMTVRIVEDRGDLIDVGKLRMVARVVVTKGNVTASMDLVRLSSRRSRDELRPV